MKPTVLAPFRATAVAAAVAVATFVFAACGTEADAAFAPEDDVDVDVVVDGAAELALCADPDGCGADPETSAPTPAPPTFGVRTDTSSTVQFVVNSGWTSYALQKRAPAGAWATATSTGLVVSGNTRKYVDGGRTPDTVRCYRLRATNAWGTRYGAERCSLTLPPPGGSNPAVNRLQLEVKVANISEAQTGSAIGVHLNRLAQPGYSFNGLNPAPRFDINAPPWFLVDSFARGRTFRYELESGGIKNLRDITEINLTNFGSDAVCIESITLFVNGGRAYVKNFGPSTCAWIESEAGSALPRAITVSLAELRAASSFVNFIPPGRAPWLEQDELERRIEGIVGNVIFNSSDVDWGYLVNYDAVGTAATGPNTVHTNLDLEVLAPNWPNPALDVQFDLTFAFVRDPVVPGTWDLEVRAQNLVSSTSNTWWSNVLSPLCAAEWVLGGTAQTCTTRIDSAVQTALDRSLGNLARAMPLTTDAELAQRNCTVPLVTVSAVDEIATPRLDFSCR